MDINKVLIEYDNMFGLHPMEEIEEFLTEKIESAYEEKDYYSAAALLNEMVGFCRDTSQNEKGLRYCEKVPELWKQLGLEGTVEHATALMNVANAYRAFGLHDKSLELFRVVEVIYRAKLPAGEFNFAGLYNNWSLLYQEMGEFEDAERMLKRALSVVDLFPEAMIPQANTRTNLAATLLRLSQTDGRDDEERQTVYDEAMRYLREALDIYEADGGRDFHYSAALSAMGDALYMEQRFGEAADYYKHAMEELEKHIGRTEAFDRVAENYERAFRRACETERTAEKGAPDNCRDACKGENGFRSGKRTFKNNMERCRAFYETYGASMIHEQFAEYEPQIAVGLVGEGSDCFGFDDVISMDHDYGVGFCMWLSDEDYEKIGFALHKVYERLVLEHGREFLEQTADGFAGTVSKCIDGRRGVFRISAFYENILGTNISLRERFAKDSRNEADGSRTDGGQRAAAYGLLLGERQWLQITEDKFATAVNGQVFRDDEGAFSAVRSALTAYYPQKIWLLRLAEKLHDFAQYAQSNYARMMARHDYVTANICVAEGTRSAMELAYLLNRTYAPYYKWMRRGMERLTALRELIPLIDRVSVMQCQEEAWENRSYSPYEINREDAVIMVFEEMAEVILAELRRQELVNGTERFMDGYCGELAERAMRAGDSADSAAVDFRGDIRKEAIGMENGAETGREKLIDEIVKTEWRQFDKVKNEGGRADCQDDWNTFSIMRKSQYMAWTDELLASYLNDLKEAESRGWNLIMEKYARMMKSTAPERYAGLEAELPKRSDERTAIAEEIISIQVAWMEEFAEKYPKMAGNARSIHTEEDSAYNTSYETYLRGELGTYSETTFVLYGRFVVETQKKGENLAYNIMRNTALLYGYQSPEDAESRL